MTGILEGIGNVMSPGGGFLSLDMFDPVPVSLSDGRILSKENIPGSAVEGAVTLLSCMDALARDTGFEVDDQVLLERVEDALFEKRHLSLPGGAAADAYAKGITCRSGGFDAAAADCACRLALFLTGGSGFANPSRMRADDRTCSNIVMMTERMQSFLLLMGPARRVCFRLPGGSAIDRGYGVFLTDGCLWDVTTSPDPLPEKARLRLLVRYAM